MDLKIHGLKRPFDAVRPFAGLLLAGYIASAACSPARADSAEERLASPAALTAYCEGLQKYDQLLSEADKLFGVEGTPEKLAWTKQGDQGIAEWVSDAIGVPSLTVFGYAVEHDWEQQCAQNRRY